MTQFLVVMGTRPEAIKMAPIVRALRARISEHSVLVCSTGQHREMLDQTLQIFDLAPDIDLAVMQHDQGLSGLGARVLTAMDEVLSAHTPDWVLVQGDTTSVAMAAIAANHRRTRVAHIEAGLRTYDRANPFPEEMNRVITDHIADLNFAPTIQARDNLLREGIDRNRIYVSGNTGIDSLLMLSQQPWQPEPSSALSSLPYDRDLLLVTAHRRENFGEPLNSICAALRQLADRWGDSIHIVYPVHRNPNIWETVHKRLDGVRNITLLPPVDYRTQVYLMKRSKLILTDSGGIQEEAPALGKPVLVMRETTERPEAVDSGAALLVGVESDSIVSAVEILLTDRSRYASMATIRDLYGDGHAAKRIATRLLEG